MQIWAFDPGAVATGVAYFDDDGSPWWNQFTDPLKAWEQLDCFGGRDAVVLVEDYRSGSQLTKEAKATIEIVGFFKLEARRGWGWGKTDGAIVRVEQHRLSGQREAAELMNGTIDHLKSDPNLKDAFSALAHCCAYRRTIV